MALPFLLVLALLVAPACAIATPLEDVVDRGEVLRIRGYTPSTLDPSIAGDSISWGYLLQVFSGLVRLDNALEVVPDLAERWQISDGGLTYTFTLREGLVFHDGRPLTAADFKYAMERALNPATRSPVARQYLGDIVGAEDVLAGKTGDLRGVQAVDDRTVRIEIDAPKSFFLAKLTYPTSFALDRANVESGLNWFERPNGTGPFRLSGWERGSKITLARFRRHWRGPAQVRAIEFNLDPLPGIILYEHDEVDVAEVDLGTLQRVSDPGSALRAELVIQPLASTWYIGFNATKPPFDDSVVRRAFAMATDRDRLVRVYFRESRAAAAGILPPGLPGHNPTIQPPQFDPAEARRLLTSSRYFGQMPEIVLSVGQGSGPTGEAFAEMYARNLGVDVAVREHDDGFFEALERREAQMFFTGWIADYPHPENFLDILFHSRSNGNYGGYTRPELDQLLVQARVEPTEVRRNEIYTRAEQMILEDAAAIPIHHEVIHALVRPYVTGIVYTPLGILDYHGVHVGERPARRAA